MTHFAHVWLCRIGGIFPVRCAWCSHQAQWILTRQSATDGNTYTNNVCETHAAEWQNFQEGVQMEMEIDG